ncbi:MAG TPA: hypothetical protein VGF36_01850 [Rhodopila sp.]|jgi:hypothetical protein
MKKLVLAVLAALGLTAGMSPMAHAYIVGSPHTTYHNGPYDNTANSLGGRYVGGGS